MIKVDDKLWIGGSSTKLDDLSDEGIKSVLNVAQDLQGKVGWPDIEYMQIGLIDGPGNKLAIYHSAVMALATLQSKSNTLVFCHDGGRSLAICIMYLNLIHPSGTASTYIGGCGWDGWMRILEERCKGLPKVHQAHKAVFDKMNWRFLSEVIGKD